VVQASPRLTVEPSFLIMSEGGDESPRSKIHRQYGPATSEYLALRSLDSTLLSRVPKLRSLTGMIATISALSRRLHNVSRMSKVW
jgi:hypothetical protein